ncbi:MAG: response regulator [Planctomycetia bacterium]
MNLDARTDAAEGRDSSSDGNPVCYHQHCPVCGRSLQIRVTLLGQRVYCQHCGGGFIASDASCCDGGDCPDRRLSAQVEDLLERAAVALSRTGG